MLKTKGSDVHRPVRILAMPKILHFLSLRLLIKTKLPKDKQNIDANKEAKE
jgi:hypothetical protein